MEGAPERDPINSEDFGAPEEHEAGAQYAPESEQPPQTEQPWTEPALPPDGDGIPRPVYLPPVPLEPLRPQPRIPHLGHLALLFLFLLCGWVVAVLFSGAAMYFHFFGLHSLEQAKTNAPFLMSSEAIIYLVTLILCLVGFPPMWRRGFFSGLQWNGAAAIRRISLLLGAAVVCFALALLSEYVAPGPKNAPIEKLFQRPGAAWVLFAFGVTFAPFFEEMIFRGFLLPAFCTCFDWVAEESSATPASPDGSTRWAPLTLVTAFVVTSIPFIAICADPFHHFLLRGMVVLLWCLGMLLAWAYVSARSTLPRGRSAPVDAAGHPVWSFPAMVFASLYVSLCFALLHAAQQGYSLGPFVLLIVVSLVLCWARLSTRSVASSVLVHASYNFMIFMLTMASTEGFRHMQRM